MTFNRSGFWLSSGSKPEAICASLGHSKSWLYKWADRFNADDNSWSESLSRQPLTVVSRTPKEVEKIVKMVRLSLYNKDQFCGAQAILLELEDLGVKPLPSLRTINRILSRNELTNRRTGKYEPKGTPYPKLPVARPNQTHQADLVGPCYLKGPLRFYGLNVLDLSTVRCGLYPSESKSGQSLNGGFWEIWKRIGIPERIQMDNAMSFFGRPRYPRGMGPLIRLYLHTGVEPWFIPMAEPWRHGGTYRYSKLGGKTPLTALAASKMKLRFPDREEAPRSLKKPEVDRYHLVRLIRSDLKLNIFGELFPVAPELKLEYVVATIDVKDQKLKLFLDRTQVEESDYQLR